MRIHYVLFILCSLPFIPNVVSAQRLAIRTNIVHVADGALNAGMEYALNTKSTIDLSGGVRPWKRSEGYVNKYWFVQPEYRYWLCQRFNGSYFGAYVNGAQFNIGGKDMPFGLMPNVRKHRYEGWLTGVGVSYGYHYMIDKNWNIEASAGVGYEYVDYKKFSCPDVCSNVIKNGHVHYIGLNKLSLSIVYIF